MNHTAYIIAVILVMAIVTYALRAVPFFIFGGRNGGEPPKWVTYLGSVLPPAVIALLIVYCLRGIDLFSGSHGIPELVCAVAAALLHLWKRNELLSIFGATILYMILVQFVFA